MCMYLNEIENVVNDFVRDNKLFTAYDVTLAVRQKVKDRVQHHEVKREVHKMFDSGNVFGYNRTLANLAGVNPQPWIYHPLAADPTLYSGSPTCYNPVASVAASLSVVDEDEDESDDGLYEFDSTDRLCIPAKLVRQLGLHEHDQVILFKNASNDEFNIMNNLKYNGSSNAFADYVVDRYDNVRVSRNTLLKAGITGNKFAITGDTNEIKVEKKL